MRYPEISEQNFEGLARARTRQIFYTLSRNVLKYSDFIFYVATTKNNKSDFRATFDDLSKLLKS